MGIQSALITATILLVVFLLCLVSARDPPLVTSQLPLHFSDERTKARKDPTVGDILWSNQPHDSPCTTQNCLPHKKGGGSLTSSSSSSSEREEGRAAERIRRSTTTTTRHDTSHRNILVHYLHHYYNLYFNQDHHNHDDLHNHHDVSHNHSSYNHDHHDSTHHHNNHSYNNNNTLDLEEGTEEILDYFNISSLLHFRKIVFYNLSKPWTIGREYRNYSDLILHYNSNVSDPDDGLVIPLNLCKPPPEKFGFDFDGNSREDCEKVDSSLVKYQYVFQSTLDLCDMIYETLGKEGITYYTVKHPAVINTHSVYLEPMYVRLCEPLHRKFGDCEDDGYLTSCHQNAITFVNPTTCPVFDNAATISLLLNNMIPDQKCDTVRDICTGDKSITSYHVDDLGVVILKARALSFNENRTGRCQSISYSGSRENAYLIINTNWPSCYAMNIIIWSANPETHGLRGGWSYLPTNCMVVEAVFIGVVGGVAVSGVAGNTLVLAVMSDKKKLSESRLLRTSLAVSDLLMGLFVVLPSLYYHLVPILYPPDYEVHFEMSYLSIHSTHIINGGLGLVQAMLRTVCTLVSYFTLFMLSVERFVLCGRPLKYRDYCSTCTIKVTITFIWLLAFLDTLLLTYNEDDGWFSSEWHAFSKLPTGTNYYYTGTVLAWWALRATSFFTFLVIFSTILFSLLAIVRFLFQQRKERGEWRRYALRVSKSIGKADLYIITGLSLMTLLFVLSILPTTVIIVCNVVQIEYPMGALYISDWSLLLSTAWNPWLYNFRDSKFRKDTSKLLWSRTRLAKGTADT